MKWLLALLALALTLLTGTAWIRHRMVGEVAYLPDRTYVDLGVASRLNTDRTLGLEPQQSAPAVRDTLWRSLLALSDGTGSVSPLIPLYWNAALLGLLLALIMAWVSGVPGPQWRRGLAGLLLLAAAPLLTQALNGGSEVLAAALVLGAAMLQIRGFVSGALPLMPGTAVLLGLAGWLRLECTLWWVIFVLHAAIVSALRGPGRRPWLWLLLRALIGVLLIALILSPLVAWNMRVVGVPWPRALDGLVLQAAGAGDLVAPLLEGLRRWPQAVTDLHAQGPLRLVPLLAVFWIGLISTSLKVVRKDVDGGYLLPAVGYVVLPVLHALVSPWLGKEGAAVLYASASALWLPPLVEGCWAIGHSVTRFLRRAGLREDAWLTPTRAAWLLASVLVLWGLRDVGQELRSDSLELRRLEAARQSVLRTLHEVQPRPRRVATDAPGWLAGQFESRILDLDGQLSPALLALAGAGGRIDPPRLRHHLLSHGVGVIVVWGAQGRELQQLGQPLRPPPEAEGRCAIIRLGPPGAPGRTP